MLPWQLSSQVPGGSYNDRCRDGVWKAAQDHVYVLVYLYLTYSGMLCFYIFWDASESILRWPRELNVLQLRETHINRKNTSKLRKYHQFDNTCAANTHNATTCRNTLHMLSVFGWDVSMCSAFLYLVALWVFAAHFCRFCWVFTVRFCIWLPGMGSISNTCI